MADRIAKPGLQIENLQVLYGESHAIQDVSLTLERGILAWDLPAEAICRIVELLDWTRTDASEAAARLAATWSGAEEAFRASKSGRNLLENAPELEDDIPFCARESVLDVVPRFAGMRNGAAEILP